MTAGGGAAAPSASGQAAPSASGRPARGRAAVAADGELPALRTGTSRTYRLSGGVLQARLFDRPVNHRDTSGVWQRNDNTLHDDTSADSSGAGGATNGAAAYQLHLPKSLGNGPVRMAVGGDRVDFSLQGAGGPAVRRDGDTAVYPGALPGVDLSYQLQDTGIKETLVLAGPDAPDSYDFAARPAGGLSLVQTPDGGLAAQDRNGTDQLVFSAPSVQDSSAGTQGFSTTATRLTLTGTSQAPVVHVTVDPTWLRNPARVFPIRLDPSLSLDTAGQTFLSSGSPASSFAAASNLQVGTDSAASRLNTLVKFPISASIPRDATVYSAQLALNVSSAGANAGGSTLQAKALTRTWTPSSTTWNTYDGTNAWTTAGGDTTATNADSRTFTAGATSMTFSPKQIVANWVSGALANNGLQLSSTNTTAGSTVTFAKTTGTSPLLTVTYGARTGDQPYYTYTSQQLTDRSQLKVNVATGNMLLSENDLQITAPGFGTTIARSFNNRDDSEPTLLMASLWRQTTGNDERMTAVTGGMVQSGPTGTNTFFPQNGTGTYSSAAGSGADLISSSSGSVLTDRTSGLVKTYDSTGALSSVKDRNGNVSNYAYNALTGGLNTITDTVGRQVTFSYDPSGLNTTGMTDSSGRTWSYGYDATSGYLSSATDPAGKVTSYGYDLGGNLTSIVTPGGRKTLIGYETNGRRATSVVRVTDTAANTGPTTRYAYTATSGGGGSTAVTDPNGKITTYTYDTASRVTKATDPLGHVRSNTYDVNNSVTSAVDAMSPGGTSSSAFDSDFRSMSSTAPTGAKATLRYAETAGTVTSKATHYLPSGGVDANGSDTSYTYDGPGNVSKTSTTAPSGAVATSNTYNPPAGTAATCGGKPGQVCSSTDGNANTTSYTYDTAGNQTTATPPAPLGRSTSSYDSLGRVTSFTDGKGQTTRTNYDNLDRITQVQFGGVTTCTATDISNGNCLTYSYDADGNRTSQVDQTGTTTYGYDNLSRQTSKTLPGQAAQTLAYDPAGNVTTATDAGGTTGYGYDAANELTSLAEPGGSCTASPTVRCTTFGYNNNGQRISTTYPTSPATTVMSLTPDASGRVKQIRAVTGTTVQSDFTYTYASSTGNDTALTASRTDNAAALTTIYSYDALNRLTGATEKNSAASQTAAWSYGYDNAGNRTSATIGTTTNTFGYNTANELTSRNGSTTGFAYDANGNETGAASASTRTSSWNNHDQLASLTSGGVATPFAYTGASQNERTSRDGTTFTTSPTGLATETNSGATTSYIRDPSGTLVAERVGGNSYYYLFDGLGSVVGLVNTAGSKVNSYSYDPYGISRSKTEGVTNPWQYTGGYLDTATGLYKLGIRYYDPTLARFTQIDPSQLDDYDYAYVGNNPVNFTDPNGDCPICALVPALAIPGVGEVLAAGAIAVLGTYVAVKGVEAGIAYASEHKKNARPSSEEQHEKAEARRKKDQEGEKKQKSGRYSGNSNRRRGSQ